MTQEELAALLRKKVTITGDGNVFGKDNTVNVAKQDAGDYAIQIGQVNVTLSLDELRRLLAAADAPHLFFQTTPRMVDDEMLAAARERLTALPLDTIPDPAPLPLSSRMPLSRNPLFVGREADLQALAAALKAGETAAIGQVEIAAATGLGGIGKTQLASEFVHRYGQFFAGGVFWLSFADPNAIPAEVASCGGLGHLNLRPDFGGLLIDEQVQLVLATWQNPLPCLLVFDNCEAPALLARWRPPSGGARVLVTSRRAEWDAALGVRALPLGVLSRTESIALLRKHRPDLPDDDFGLDAIAEELGDLPLALHLAGSCLARYQHVITPPDYLAQLQHPDLLQHRSLQGGGFSPTGHEGHVARTFALSYEQLNPASPTDRLAMALLARAAYFAPGEPIPRELLRATLPLPEQDPETALQAEDALTRLLVLGLLESEAQGALRLHRLVAVFVKGIADDPGAQAAVEQVILTALDNRIGREGRLGPLPMLQSHLRAVTSAAQVRDDERAAGLCSLLGRHLDEIGDYIGARPYLERAIAGWEQVLSELEREAASVTWARIQSNLATAYRDRILDDRGENLERAIAACAAALEVYTRTDFPIEWAKTQSNLATVYRDRIHGDRTENLERAIAALFNALEVCTRVDFPVDWAAIHNNLGTAYSERIRGDRAENLERAITAYTAALEIRTRADFPVDWAETQNNLGNAYSERIHGDRAENLERAIAAYAAALEVYTRDDFPVQWATTQNNLGTAYVKRIRGDRAENLERAITTYTAALDIRTWADFPLDWATTQNNLGIAYSERIHSDRAENLERAIAAHSAALEVYTRAHFPVQWARIQIDLGDALRERIRGDWAENLEQAIAAYHSAIEAAQVTGIRDDERRAARNLGHLYYDEGQWSLAYAAFDTAITALETMRTAYFSEEAKAHLAEENAPLYACMTDTCLHLSRPQEALERAEASNERLFLDQLGTDVSFAPSLPSAQGPLLERETRLAGELRPLTNAIRNAPDEAHRRQYLIQQGERRIALDEVWAQLEPHAPDYVALRRGDPVRYDQLQALVNGFGTAAALVEFYTLPEKIIAFILRSGEQAPAVAQVPMSQARLLRHVQNYWREVTEYPRHGDIGQHWQEVAGPLLDGVLPYLQGVELVYLVAHGLLNYLPLHALRVQGSYLIDHFPVAYAPSAAVLSRVVQRTAGMERSKPIQALVVGNPTLDMHHEHREAQQVAQLFGVQPYLGRKATKAMIQSELGGKDVVHLACHGYFHPTEPMQSGVVLAGHESLTAQEIMGLSLQAYLVTLNACKTGRSNVIRGDELVGLTRALLYAGTSSTLVSLWAVDDESTGQLMTSFYSRLYDDRGRKVKTAASALREAMLELRKTKEHPYYWAPFILVGDWR
ncbi:MAG: CHAT domain-containing protein [Chloroflexota bacterium]|nr:CHAT domain-containing protein [Chloroflexota bacterium]